MRAPAIDSVVAFFDKLRADYSAAKESRFKRRRTGLASGGAGADFHIRNEGDYLRMIEIARDVYRNDIVVGQGCNRLVDEVFMDGFKLDPLTGDKGLDLELWNRWDTWWNDPEECHLAGEFNGPTLARLAFLQVLVDGDILHILNPDGALEPVEAHRIRTSKGTNRNVVHGVLLDAARRRLEYWLTKDDIDPSRPVSFSEIRRYPARDKDGNRQAVHLYLPKRVTQTRGVSVFAPCLDAIGMHDDIQFARLVQQQAVSCFTLIHNRDVDFDDQGKAPTGFGATQETTPSGYTRQTEKISPGSRYYGAPGEKVEGFSPNVPNPQYFEHVMMILSLVAVNLNLPVQVLLLDPKATNFSGWRGAMDQARLTFRELQRWFSSSFLRHVYEWKLRQWVAEDQALGKRKDEDTIKRHRWNAPRWPYIEPLKDAQADAMRLEKRLISPRRLHAEHGHEWEEIVDETVEDNAYLIRQAKTTADKINTEYPDDPITWRDLLGLDMTQAPPPPTPPEEEEETGDQPAKRKEAAFAVVD